MSSLDSFFAALQLPFVRDVALSLAIQIKVGA